MEGIKDLSLLVFPSIKVNGTWVIKKTFCLKEKGH